MISMIASQTKKGLGASNLAAMIYTTVCAILFDSRVHYLKA